MARQCSGRAARPGVAAGAPGGLTAIDKILNYPAVFQRWPDLAAGPGSERAAQEQVHTATARRYRRCSPSSYKPGLLAEPRSGPVIIPMPLATGASRGPGRGLTRA